ncbi:MAG: hypothetical protein R2874_09910 [Desulfobacterales bacterium]
MEADIGIPAPAVFSQKTTKDEKHHRLALGFETDTPAGSADRFSVDFGWQRQRTAISLLVSRRIKFHLSCRVIWKFNIWVDIDTYTLKPQMVFTLTTRTG